MGTPINERGEPQYTQQLKQPDQRSSDEDGTVVGDDSAHLNPDPAPHTRPRAHSHLTVNVDDDMHGGDYRSMASPSQTREQNKRLEDDLAMLEMERQVSNENNLERETSNGRSLRRTRSRREDPIDEFDTATNPLHERAAVYKPPEHPSTNLAKFFKKVHNSSFIVRWFTYITPLVLLLLIPVLLGFFVYPDALVGCVELKWFGIWLEIVWLTLWAGRVRTPCASTTR